MKHGRFAIGLLLMAGIAVAAAFGDEQAFVLEAIVMDSFDDGVPAYWGETLEWKSEASKFATVVKDEEGNKVEEESFPKIQRIATWPEALYPKTYLSTAKDTEYPDEESRRSLGINSSFTRRGYNWVDVYPVGPDAGDWDADRQVYLNKGIGFDLPGRAQYLDMWVWGSNLNYTLEAYFRDYNGVIRTVDMGSLAYEGWKNLRVRIPSNFSQTKKVLPNYTPLRFIKFRIWTSPTEIVDQPDLRFPNRKTGVYIYFDNLRILTDMFEAPYDGRELEDIKRTDELWGRDELTNGNG
jgi:hypothetical protein